MRKYAFLFLLFFVAGAIPFGLMLASQRTDPPDIRNRIGNPPDGKLEKSDAYWRETLTPEQYEVTRQKGTEMAYSGAYWQTKDDGIYECSGCGQALFDSKTKFESRTGWPSFWQPIDDNRVSLFGDNTLGMSRTEVECSRCGAHLGHVFSDGPPPTGLRYCMNSVSLKLVPRKDSPLR
jgi:peptide-methionine (R)-S-oxide reductase